MKRNPRASRDRVFRAALRKVARCGYAGASIQDIADEAGTTKPVIYYYFGNKVGLYQALIDHSYDERLKVMQAAADKGQDLQAQLVAIFESLLRFAQERQDLMRICFATAFAAPEEIPRGIRFIGQGNQMLQFVEQRIRLGMRRQRLRSGFTSQELAVAIFSQMMFQAMARVIAPKKFKGPSARRVVELFLNGAIQGKRRMK